MLFIYNILINITGFVLKLLALFNNKLKLFINGRKSVFETLSNKIDPSDKIIWFHTASMGEFEQGIPVIEQTKAEFPNHKILVTFFSPSGYELKKNSSIAHVITYLPLDTKINVKKFLDIVHPELAIFVKYEFWPNYLAELKIRNINTLLISAIFRKEQVFFKPYGSFLKNSLKTFHHFYVQDENSKQLLRKIGYKNVTVSGDTRFDRVMEILKSNNNLDFIQEFKQNKLCFVAGSTWPEDEKIIVDFINKSSNNDIKFIIAPHNIKGEHIKFLKKSLKKKNILFSEKNTVNLAEYDVFILDTIGILTKVYSYADVAYVGGGIGKTGLHNVLEPAVFGIPVIIGNHYSNFKEAVDLVNLGGIITIKNKDDFDSNASKLFENNEENVKIGHINKIYVTKKIGAKVQIGYQIRKLL